MSIFDKLEGALRRFEGLTEKMADPTLYDRQAEFKQLTSERSNLLPVVEAYNEYKKIKADLEGAKDMLIQESDDDLREMAKEEIVEKEKTILVVEARLKILLLPRDPLDDKNILLELRAGAGGDEASIFVGDVLRMYQNYFKTLGFRTEMVSASQGDHGLKEVIVNVIGDQVYSKLKYESGVHRVQRVPDTEAQGRVHTSTITVAIIPEAEEVEFELHPNDLRIDVYRAGGSGGQSVNTSDSAVRITHLPTNTVVAMQDERSQLKNKDKAMKVLRARIYDKMVRDQHAKESAERKELVGTGDRSERIRTYNFPQGRLSDHRIGLTVYNLDQIMNGDLGPVVDAIIAHYQAEALKGED